MYPRNTEYMDSWNGKIALPQGWAKRNGESDTNSSNSARSSQNPNHLGRMVREVSTTIHSSQRASDAVDRLIDAINDGKNPVYDPHRYQLGIRDNSSLFKRREVYSYCPSSRVQGPKSRVRKVIEEFLEVARKRGLYSSSPPRNRYSSDAVPGCRSTQSKKCGWKPLSCTQPVRYSSNCSQHEDSHKWQQLPFSSQFNRLYSPDTDSFPQSNSPDLFEINEHVASIASTTDATFVDQSRNDFFCFPYESTYIASQPPYRVKEQTKRVSHPRDSNFWLSSQPDLQPFLQSSAYRGPTSHETETMNPLLTRAESNLKSTSQWNTNEPSNPSHSAASIARDWRSNQKKDSCMPIWKTSPKTSASLGYDEHQQLWTPVQSGFDSKVPRYHWPSNQTYIPHQDSSIYYGVRSQDAIKYSEENRKPRVHCVCCRFYGSRTSTNVDQSIQSPIKHVKRAHDYPEESNCDDPNIPWCREITRNSLPKRRATSDNLAWKTEDYSDRDFQVSSFRRKTGNSSQPPAKYSKLEFQPESGFEFISPIEKLNDKRLFGSVTGKSVLPSYRLDTEKLARNVYQESVAKRHSSFGLAPVKLSNHYSESYSGQEKEQSSTSRSSHIQEEMPSCHRSAVHNAMGEFTPIEGTTAPKFISPPEPRGLVQSVNSKTTMPERGVRYGPFNALATSTPCIGSSNSAKENASTNTNEVTSTESNDYCPEKLQFQGQYMKTPDWVDRDNLSVGTSKLIIDGIQSVTLSNLQNYATEE